MATTIRQTANGTRHNIDHLDGGLATHESEEGAGMVPNTLLTTASVVAICHVCDWRHYSQSLVNGSAAARYHVRVTDHRVTLTQTRRRAFGPATTPAIQETP